MLLSYALCLHIIEHNFGKVDMLLILELRWKYLFDKIKKERQKGGIAHLSSNKGKNVLSRTFAHKCTYLVLMIQRRRTETIIDVQK